MMTTSIGSEAVWNYKKKYGKQFKKLKFNKEKQANKKSCLDKLNYRAYVYLPSIRKWKEITYNKQTRPLISYWPYVFYNLTDRPTDKLFDQCDFSYHLSLNLEKVKKLTITWMIYESNITGNNQGNIILFIFKKISDIYLCFSWIAILIKMLIIYQECIIFILLMLLYNTLCHQMGQSNLIFFIIWSFGIAALQH